VLSVQPIDHVKALCSEIGPRGPTTEAEARAAAYAAGWLERLGARDVSVETFRSVPSLWWALEIASVLSLVSTAIYYFGKTSLWGWAALLCLAAVYIIIAEMSFWRLSLSNFLPKRVSQNVYGKVPPRKEPRKKLVVIGHLDTNRTPILFHPRLVRFLPAALGAAVGCVILKALVYCLCGIIGGHGGVVVVLLILDLPVAVMLLAMLHGDFVSPFTEGANDNATGAAVALSLAELFTVDPLEHTEYWALCTGCEEATLTGIKSFLQRHAHELQDASFVDLECIGIGQLRYVTHEGMLKKFHSNAGLVRAAADAARVIDDPSIQAMPLRKGYTETAIVVKHGLKGITIMAMPEGSEEVPHWHCITDRIENIEPQKLNKAVHFIATLARELDAG